jgi:spore germination protein (amino acid permease)
MKKNEYITSYGLFSTIVVTVVGINMFSYPRLITEAVGTDGWIETIIFALINMLFLKVIWEIIKLNNFNEFTTIVKKNLGGFIGSLVLIIFAVLEIIYISLNIRAFSEVLRIYLLENTPTEFIIITTILCGTYLIRAGRVNIVRFNEISFGVMYIPLILILIVLAFLGDYSNILPVMHNKPVSYAKGLVTAMASFLGFEIAFLVVPLLKNKERAHKIMKRSNMFIALFYVILTVIAVAVFTKDLTGKLLWPTITLMKSVNIKGAFVERWEGLVMVLWILFFFTTFCNGYYFAGNILKETFRIDDVRISSLIIVPFFYLIAMIPGSIVELEKVTNLVIPCIFLVNIIIIPLLLYVISRYKYKTKKGEV